MPRKPADEWAVLAVPGPRLRKALDDKNISLRQAADLCGHASHTHIYRLTLKQDHKRKVHTTSLHTANVLEAITGMPGLLFARMTTRTLDRTAA